MSCAVKIDVAGYIIYRNLIGYCVVLYYTMMLSVWSMVGEADDDLNSWFCVVGEWLLILRGFFAEWGRYLPKYFWFFDWCVMWRLIWLIDAVGFSSNWCIFVIVASRSFESSIERSEIGDEYSVSENKFLVEQVGCWSTWEVYLESFLFLSRLWPGLLRR